MGPAAYEDNPPLTQIYADKEFAFFFSDVASIHATPRYIIKYDYRTKLMNFLKPDSFINFEDFPYSENCFSLIEQNKYPVREDIAEYIKKLKNKNNGYYIVPKGKFSKSISIHRNGSIFVLPELTKKEISHWSKYINRDFNKMSEKELFKIYIFENALAGDYLVENSIFYGGLFGSTSEGFGGIGGLIIYDFANGGYDIYRTKFLVCGTISSIVKSADMLYMSAYGFGEYFHHPVSYYENGKKISSNLISYSIEQDKWTNLDEKGIFADCIIRKIQYYDNKLFVISNLGIGVIDLSNMSAKRYDWKIRLEEVVK